VGCTYACDGQLSIALAFCGMARCGACIVRRRQSGTGSWSREQFFDSFSTFCSSGPTLPVGSPPSRQHTLAADSAHGLPLNGRAHLRHACELMRAHLLLVPAFLSLEVYVVTSNSTRFSVAILGGCWGALSDVHSSEAHRCNVVRAR
jgi:hypothetical protein